MDGYATAQEAARGDIPALYARAVAVSGWRDHAFVVLQTNEPPHVEMYEVMCIRDEDGRWRPEGGSGGLGLGGWSSCGHTGLVTCAGEAPDDVVAVWVRFGGEVAECPVREGCFLFAEWGGSFEEYQALGEPLVVAHVKTSGEVVDHRPR